MTKMEIEVSMEKMEDARPIALLVQEASKYESSIYLEMDGKRINAKSIMGMMSLSLCTGEKLTVTADGEDEQNAVHGIEKFLTGAA